MKTRKKIREEIKQSFPIENLSINDKVNTILALWDINGEYERAFEKQFKITINQYIKGRKPEPSIQNK